MIAAGLCRKGYFEGDPSRVLKSPVDIVLKLVKYEYTMSEYEDIVSELNKNEDS